MRMIANRTLITVPPTLQVLNNPPQAVSMGSDEHSLALFDLRRDLVVPEGQCPCDGVLKALAGRKLVLGQVCIATILQGRQSLCKIHNGPE